MEIWIVISAMCSPLGFSDVKILGSFVDEGDAIEFKKDQCPNMLDNYRVTLKKTFLQFRKNKNVEIPESARLGYD